VRPHFFAEREGFEPSVPFRGTHAFQACQLNHSCISPFFHRSLGEGGISVWRRKIQKYFYISACYEISPASEIFKDSTTLSFEEYVPRRCMSFVTEASDVISFPLTTPAASICLLVSYNPISTLPP
jgi:hypothetical protein